jgi:hypothetical protein
VDHLSNMPDPVALSSPESEYNEACLACQPSSHLHMTLNELEQVERVGLNDKTVDILLDNK